MGVKFYCPEDDNFFIFLAVHIHSFRIYLRAGAGVNGVAGAEEETSEMSTSSPFREFHLRARAIGIQNWAQFFNFGEIR
jgi:hypothetical protein